MATPSTVAVTEKDPGIELAVRADAVALPPAVDVTMQVFGVGLPPAHVANVPDGPEDGAVKVTLTLPTPVPPVPVTLAASAVAKLLPITTYCGVPAEVAMAVASV